jgi:hypothetical protein
MQDAQKVDWMIISNGTKEVIGNMTAARKGVQDGILELGFPSFLDPDSNFCDETIAEARKLRIRQIKLATFPDRAGRTWAVEKPKERGYEVLGEIRRNLEAAAMTVCNAIGYKAWVVEEAMHTPIYQIGPEGFSAFLHKKGITKTPAEAIGWVKDKLRPNWLPDEGAMYKMAVSGPVERRTVFTAEETGEKIETPEFGESLYLVDPDPRRRDKSIFGGPLRLTMAGVIMTPKSPKAGKDTILLFQSLGLDVVQGSRSSYIH